ncbi:MAG: type IV toxin-antitoxin system AbiEi family antitoxin [Microbacterium sp.]|uniref:hypothetical protein n=1 Tax=Microbacterium sp. TaxID=51671 RepID=UPI003BAE458B
MHPALFYLPGDRLMQPELSAARLDGHVVEIGEGYIPADVVEGPEARAAGLRSLIQVGMAASGPSAAWIHGAGDRPPSPHHARRAIDRRLRPPVTARLVFHDSRLAPGDVVQIGGMAVSSPLRTMIDLALGIHRAPAFAVWATALADVFPELVVAAAQELRVLNRVPGTRAALTWLAQQEKTPTTW